MNKVRRAKLNAIINALNDLRSDLELVHDEEQDVMDNMPESLQESERYERMEEAVDNMDDAMSSLDDAVDSLECAME